MHTNPEVLALLALGEDVGTPAEHEHIASCPTCNAEVAELAELTGIGRRTTTEDTVTRPSPDVWQRVRSELGFAHSDSTDGASISTPVTARADAATSGSGVGTVTAMAPPTDLDSRRAAGSISRRWILLTAVAAALTLVVGLGAGIGLERLTRDRLTVVAEAPLAPVTQRWSDASGSATVEQDADGNRILVVQMATTTPIDGDRQVWLADPTLTKMTNLGYLRGDSGRFNLSPSLNLGEFSVVDISDEPLNDGDPLHSGVSILRGKLPA